VSAYYNEIDPFAAAWLRELIKAGLIADGEVDTRSIESVSPDDLRGFTQCHFFAGIGGWSQALRLASWSDDRRGWTGSCPCQPLSCAGQRQGHADERHLWPTFYRLIAECRPAVVFGEQVASADGREWLAGVRADLEALAYACGGADLCAASAGAPQPRQRLYWVADANRDGFFSEGLYVRQGQQGATAPIIDRRAAVVWLSDAAQQRPRAEKPGDGTEEAHYRWPHEAPPNRRFVDGFGNAYRIPESGIPFLADGFPGIVDQIRAAGNAIVPQVAAAFIEAYCECRG
jgi:DNA (cytosine-5)-methyltransferase 1